MVRESAGFSGLEKKIYSSNPGRRFFPFVAQLLPLPFPPYYHPHFIQPPTHPFISPPPLLRRDLKGFTVFFPPPLRFCLFLAPTPVLSPLPFWPKYFSGGTIPKRPFSYPRPHKFGSIPFILPLLVSLRPPFFVSTGFFPNPVACLFLLPFVGEPLVERSPNQRS